MQGSDRRQMFAKCGRIASTNDITAYLIKIGVGEPAQEFPRLLIDTGVSTAIPIEGLI